MGFVKKIFKGVKKVVSKVSKVVKKAAPLLVVAGALYFTAGVAMGLPGAGAGWAASVKSWVSTVPVIGEGLSGAMLKTAVTYAGYGAVGGLATALVTGTDPWKGIKQGALAGAVLGAGSGALDHLAPAGAGVGTGAGPGGPGGASATGPVGSGVAPQPGEGWGDALKAAIKTPEFIGHAVSGIGKGIGGVAQARASERATQQAQDRFDEIRDSYRGIDTSTSLSYPTRGASGVSPVTAGTAQAQGAQPVSARGAAPVAGGAAPRPRDEEKGRV